MGSKRNKPREQHYVPRVYLKQFQIDDVANRSFVYCRDLGNPYNIKVQRVGLNDRVFKLRNYYNDRRLTDPFLIERVMGTDIEPTYDNIMQAIKQEGVLSAAIREDIVVWLFFTQFRAPHIRDNAERIMRFIIDSTNEYNKHRPDQDEQMVIAKYISQTAREVQLNCFSSSDQTSELAKSHIETLNSKHWKILKSFPEFPFWANDNPGFSPNQHERFASDQPFHPVMELNAHSIIYFVLSPQYCLEIRPFFQGTPLDLCAINMDIKYEQADLEYIDYINEGVFYTRHRLLISNKRTLLERKIKMRPRATI
jgi:Protein of unknown function (DUF4238)